MLEELPGYVPGVMTSESSILKAIMMPMAMSRMRVQFTLLVLFVDFTVWCGRVFFTRRFAVFVI
jgi:hypothetical protein